MRGRDYLQLVNWTGRRIIDGKASIPRKIPSILDRIGHDQRSWSRAIELLGTRRYTVVGPVDDLRLWAKRIGQKYLHGVVTYAGVF